MDFKRLICGTVFTIICGYGILMACMTTTEKIEILPAEETAKLIAGGLVICTECPASNLKPCTSPSGLCDCIQLRDPFLELPMGCASAESNFGCPNANYNACKFKLGSTCNSNSSGTPCGDKQGYQCSGYPWCSPVCTWETLGSTCEKNCS